MAFLLRAGLAGGNAGPCRLQTAADNFRGSRTCSRLAHILLKGIARITSQNARGERVTIALLPLGPIPEFPLLPFGRFGFRCEAYDDCRVGSLSWSTFEGISAHRSESAFKTFHQNDLRQCYRLLQRSSSFLNLDLHERIAITLLELALDFGIKESRGSLLRGSATRTLPISSGLRGRESPSTWRNWSAST